MSHRQRLTLLAAILGSALATIDGSIVNVALPAIEQDLGGGLSAQQWVSNAYLLALGSLILIGGSLGDIYGERRVFAIGVAAFGVVSVACALAPTIEVLIGARALQGAAAALVTPSSLAIIVAAFGPSERGAAIGSWTAWGGIAAIVGPLAGGVDRRPSLVALDLRAQRAARPCDARADLCGRAASASARRTRRVDYVGAALCALGLGGLRVRADRAAELRLAQPGDPRTARRRVVAFAAFLAYERRAAEPMLKLELFSRRNFAVGNARDARDVRGARDPLLLPRHLPAAGRRATARSRAGSTIVARDVGHVRALAPFRGARRSVRAAPLHGRRAADRGGRDPAASSSRIGDRRTSPIFCRRCSCSRSDSRSPSPRSRRPSSPTPTRAMPVSPPRSTTRRARRRPRRGLGRRRRRREHARRRHVRSERRVGDGLSSGCSSSAQFSSLQEASLGAIGIVNPRRAVGASTCPGGQLVGVPQRAVESTPPTSGMTVEPTPHEA